MKRIGILGGTFDPIHNAHLAMARDAIGQAALDLVYFMPTSQNPLKDNSPIASDVHRYRMIELAIRGEFKMDILDYEIVQPYPSYTIDTVNTLTKNFPSIQFSWIIGSDNVGTLHQWKSIEKLSQKIEFLVAARPDHTPDTSLLGKNFPITFFENTPYDISASDIRHKLANNISIKNLVPEAVELYLLVNNIYEQSKT